LAIRVFLRQSGEGLAQFCRRPGVLVPGGNAETCCRQLAAASEETQSRVKGSYGIKAALVGSLLDDGRKQILANLFRDQRFNRNQVPLPNIVIDKRAIEFQDVG